MGANFGSPFIGFTLVADEAIERVLNAFTVLVDRVAEQLGLLHVVHANRRLELIR
jgi:hypothetical protein